MLLVLLTMCWLLPTDAFNKDYFTAAVFEHRPAYYDIDEAEPEQHKTESLNLYEKAAGLAAQQGVDIILFNEFGTFVYPEKREKFFQLAEHVPDPKRNHFNPCTEQATDRMVLHKASCLARDHKMYVVVNLLDVQPCDSFCDADQVANCNIKCPDDGVYFYNTDVAFDREGNLIARYHKMHPYFEANNVPDGPELITFDTEFGKFGMIVCFDLVFEEAVRLVKEHNIDTLLFPTYWFDDIVPLVAVEFQQSFAIANGVNLMAANAHTPVNGTIGSGIYTKQDGALVYTYEPNGLSKLLIANVRIKGNSQIPEINSITVITEDKIFPVTETGEEFPEQSYAPVAGPFENVFTDYRTYKLKVENYTVVKLEKASDKLQACHNGFCCSLSYSAADMKEDFYLAVFNGLNNVKGYYQYWEETCVLTRCDPYQDKPCMLQPFTSKTVFNKVELKGNFKSQVVYPAVSKTHLRLAPKREWEFERKGSKAKIEFHANSDVPFLRATLYGRDYERDPPFDPYWKF